MSKKELTLKQLARWFYNHEPRSGAHFESKWNHFLAQEPYWKAFMKNAKKNNIDRELNYECCCKERVEQGIISCEHYKDEKCLNPVLMYLQCKKEQKERE